LKDETKAATVVAVKLSVRGGNAPPIEPLKTVALTDDYQKLTGVKLDRSGVVALFPLAALAPNAEIHVTFDQVARAPSPSTMCQECIVSINLARIRYA